MKCLAIEAMQVTALVTLLPLPFMPELGLAQTVPTQVAVSAVQHAAEALPIPAGRIMLDTLEAQSWAGEGHDPPGRELVAAVSRALDAGESDYDSLYECLDPPDGHYRAEPLCRSRRLQPGVSAWIQMRSVRVNQRSAAATLDVRWTHARSEARWYIVTRQVVVHLERSGDDWKARDMSIRVEGVG